MVSVFVTASVLVAGTTAVTPTSVAARAGGQSIATGTGGIAPAIAAGGDHACALLGSGEVTCWGDDFDGQIGNGTTTGNVDTPPTPVTLPTVDGNPSTAVAIATGLRHTCAILNSGGVSCWGSNAFGQLGNGTTTSSDVEVPPTPVTLPTVDGNPTTAVAITAGSFHTCAILNIGGVSCWGRNNGGQLGNGTTVGPVATPSDPIALPTVNGDATTAVAISAAEGHTCAVLNSGGVSCWGDDIDERLGNGSASGNVTTPPAPVTLPGNTTATAVATGASHTCALLNSGGVSCWGIAQNGRLGNGSNSGTVDAPPQPVTLPTVDGHPTTAVAITTGTQHSCALLNSGDITCWGRDFDGQLGNGSTTGDVNAPPAPIALPIVDNNPTTAVAISGGNRHTCALLSTGDATCWGADDFGQVGNGATTGDVEAPSAPISLPAPDPTVASDITTGEFHTCALLQAGSVSCWGRDNNGQLGNGPTTAADVDAPPTPVTLPTVDGNPTRATAIGARGAEHNCAILDTGGVTCWGLDNRGQLGNGAPSNDVDAPPQPVALPTVGGNPTTAVAISVGRRHSCALLNTGGVSCWGNGVNGRLGSGATADIPAPPTPITLPTVGGNPTTAVAISAGQRHTCALLNTGQVTCWGDDLLGQLGNTTTAGSTNATPPDPIILPTIDGDQTTAIAISAGGEHTCALLNTGHVSCWGNNNNGQLGNGTTDNIDTPSDPITLPTIDGNPTTAVAINAGRFHTCAELNTGDVSCWGHNDFGQLGDGTTDDRDTPSDPVTLPTVDGNPTTATAISAGDFQTCAVLNTGDLSCWGRDNWGQLGNGVAPGTDTPDLVVFETTTTLTASTTGDPTDPTITAAFQRTVDNFDTNDITINSTTGTVTATITPNTAATYNLNLNGPTTGTVTINIPAGDIGPWGNTASDTITLIDGVPTNAPALTVPDDITATGNDAGQTGAIVAYTATAT
ncbi:MAG: hypothetical protein AAGF73_17555, partial [Actinomycetota bacterium]